MSLPVDRTQSNAVNLQVLKRQDDAVMEIVDTASHVVMYEFDQDGQSWKRKEVEGCLFVVKRFSAPRFQISISNRLSTTNMTLAVDERLEVDAVDSFMILRSPDASYATGFAIYGAWFFPEEDRERIRALLTRLIQSAKDTQQTQPPLPPSGAQAAKTVKQHPKPQLQPTQATQPAQQPAQQQQQQQQQTPTPKAEKSRSRSRSRNKREKQATPTKILQRPANDSANGTNAAVKPAQDSGMIPISHADGVEAGQAILGMISQKQEPARAHTQPLLAPTALQPKPAAQQPVSKEQLKQTLISLLDDAQFFDQIYHAYVDRVHKRA